MLAVALKVTCMEDVVVVVEETEDAAVMTVMEAAMAMEEEEVTVVEVEATAPGGILAIDSIQMMSGMSCRTKKGRTTWSTIVSFLVSLAIVLTSVPSQHLGSPKLRMLSRTSRQPLNSKLLQRH